MSSKLVAASFFVISVIEIWCKLCLRRESKEESDPSSEQTKSNSEPISPVIRSDNLFIICDENNQCHHPSPPLSSLKIADIRSVITGGCQQFITRVPVGLVQSVHTQGHTHMHTLVQKLVFMVTQIHTHVYTHTPKVSVWQNTLPLYFTVVFLCSWSRCCVSCGSLLISKHTRSNAQTHTATHKECSGTNMHIPNLTHCNITTLKHSHILVPF